MTTHDVRRLLHGQQYAKRFEERQRPYRLMLLMREMRLGQEDDVVDFACGSGMLLPYVAPLVNSYVGVDFSQPFIDLATTKMDSCGISNARFECASIDEFCRNNLGAFDVAFALDISEHVADEDWLRMLTSIRRSLVRGGRLYLHTPNARFFLEAMRKRNFILKQFPQHIAVRTLEQNIVLLEKAGFRIARASFISHYNIMRLTHPLSFMPVVGKYLKARIFIEAIG